MKNILNLHVYTPQQLLLKETISRLKLQMKDQNLVILPKHLDYITSFEKCHLDFEKINGEKGQLWLWQGFFLKCGREVQISTITASDNLSQLPSTGIFLEQSVNLLKWFNGLKI